MPVSKKKSVNPRKGVYEKIIKEQDYKDYNNMVSITVSNFVVINENTPLDEPWIVALLQKFKKIRFHPIKTVLPIINWIIEKGIPEYITHIAFDFCGWNNKFNVLLDKLPIGLKYFAIVNQNTEEEVDKDDEDDEDDEDEIMDFNLNNLPNQLEELYINLSISFQSLYNLPPNLKILVIRSSLFNQSIDNLPITLETLIIENYSNCSMDKIKLDNLPPGLKHLYILKYILSTGSVNLSYVREVLPKSLVRISLPDYQYP